MSSGRKQTDRLEKDNLTVAAPVLARWLGVTGKTVYELTKAGIALRAEHGDLYRLEESVRRYCEYLRRTASQGGEASRDGYRRCTSRRTRLQRCPASFGPARALSDVGLCSGFPFIVAPR
jgi:hypothetical protein